MSKQNSTMYQTSKNGNPYVYVSKFVDANGSSKKFWAIIVKTGKNTITFQKVMKNGSVPSSGNSDVLAYYVASLDSSNLVYKPAHMNLMYGQLEVQ